MSTPRRPAPRSSGAPTMAIFDRRIDNLGIAFSLLGFGLVPQIIQCRQHLYHSIRKQCCIDGAAADLQSHPVERLHHSLIAVKVAASFASFR